MKIRTLVICCAIVAAFGCASRGPNVPYPAFIEVDTLGDVFLANLPGVRAKQLAGDPQTRRSSNRVDLPLEWKGTSGGAPGRSMEIFVLVGQIKIADIALGPGGYAFLPAGSLGFNLTTEAGARILYFVNDTDPESVIRSPIIIDSGLLPWTSTATDGVSVKMLRSDPGSGAKTWIQQIKAGATLPWTASTANREGYLMSGSLKDVECLNGQPQSGSYITGGYFLRPAGAVSGGPAAIAESDSVWVLRETGKGETTTFPDCSVRISPTS